MMRFVEEISSTGPGLQRRVALLEQQVSQLMLLNETLEDVLLAQERLNQETLQALEYLLTGRNTR